MTTRRSVARRLAAFSITALYWLADCAASLAATAKTEPEASSSSGGGAGWAVSYALLILLVALGVFVVLKPSGRRERARPEQYGEE